MPTQITDHSDQAVARLHSIHKDKANIEALVRLLVDPIQPIEDTLWQLLTERLIDTAIGEQQNVLGRIVGQPRDGLSDSDYRRHIRARIAVSKSKGLWTDLIAVARLLINDTSAVLVNSEPIHMTALMEVTQSIVSDSLGAILIDFLSQTKSDVVRMILQYSAQAAADTFTLGSVTETSATVLVSATTIPVDSTAGFEDSGVLVLELTTGLEDTAITYTSKDATNFYGCDNVGLTHGPNARCQTGASTTQGFEDDAAPGTGGKFASASASS